MIAAFQGLKRLGLRLVPSKGRSSRSETLAIVRTHPQLINPAIENEPDRAHSESARTPEPQLRVVTNTARVMPEQKSIPPDLAAAFFDAVRQYLLWAFSAPQPTIKVGSQEVVSIVSACERVSIFSDRLPDKTFNALYLISVQKQLRKKLEADPTYATGAYCLLRLIEDREAKWREDWKRTQ